MISAIVLRACHGDIIPGDGSPTGLIHARSARQGPGEPVRCGPTRAGAPVPAGTGERRPGLGRFPRRSGARPGSTPTSPPSDKDTIHRLTTRLATTRPGRRGGAGRGRDAVPAGTA